MGFARSGENFRHFFAATSKVNSAVCRVCLSIMLKVGAVRVAMILCLLRSIILQEGSNLLCNF